MVICQVLSNVQSPRHPTEHPLIVHEFMFTSSRPFVICIYTRGASALILSLYPLVTDFFHFKLLLGKRRDVN